jgi:hypothetical protein
MAVPAVRNRERHTVTYCCEAWDIPTYEEESGEENQTDSEEFESEALAMIWCWGQMELGRFTRVWKK